MSSLQSALLIGFRRNEIDLIRFQIYQKIAGKLPNLFAGSMSLKVLTTILMIY